MSRGRRFRSGRLPLRSKRCGPGTIRLRLRLRETTMRARLIKSFTFEAAHFLPTFPPEHKCRRMHGHSFRVDVAVEGEVPEERGYLVDYGDIQKAIDPVRDLVDHRCLNEVEGLDNPTSENLARWLWERFAPTLPGLAEITVQETCTARCRYRGK